MRVRECLPHWFDRIIKGDDGFWTFSTESDSKQSKKLAIDCWSHRINLQKGKEWSRHRETQKYD